MSSAFSFSPSQAIPLLRLAGPLCIAQIASISILTADIWMMGRLSAFDLASGSLAMRLYQPFYFFAVGVLSLVGPLTSQALGSGEVRSARLIFRQGLLLALGIGCLSFLPVIYGADILIFLGQQPDVARHAETFLFISAFGLTPSFLFLVLRFYTASYQRPLPQMVVAFVGLGVNIILNAALAHGYWGLPEMGLSGIALATAISHMVMVICLGLVIQLRAPFNQVSPFHRLWAVDLSVMGRIFRLGWPNGLLVMSETGMFIVAGMLIGLFGTAPLAAAGIVNQIAAVAFMIPLSLSQATAIRIGHAAGRKTPSEVIETGRTAIQIGCVLILPSMAVMLLFPEMLSQIFIKPDDSLYEATMAVFFPLLLITALFQFGDGQQIILAAMLRGLNDTRIPAIFGMIGFWAAGIGSAVIMAFILDWGPVSIWAGVAIGLFVSASLMGLRWIQTTKRLRHGGPILLDD